MFDPIIRPALLLVLCALFAFGCLHDDEDSEPAEEPDDDGAEDDAADDGDDDDTTPDDDTDEPLPPLDYPHDGRTYIGVGCLPITPTAENHPRPIYLAGFGHDRRAESVHDDLLACVVAAGRNKQYVILVSLDLVGLTPAVIGEIQEGLAAFGAARERVVVSCTHTHQAPDLIGLWGPSFTESGIDPTYRAFVIARVVQAVLEVGLAMTPARARYADVPVAVPGASPTHLLQDSRVPMVVDDVLRVIHFDTPDGAAIGTLVNWVAHPEAAGAAWSVSSDFPHDLRRRVSGHTGAPVAYFSGAVGGLMTPLDVAVPLRAEDGSPVLDPEGNPVIHDENDFDHARSYGFALADLVTAGIDAAEPQEIDTVAIHSAEFLMPVDNVYLVFAFLAGLLEDFPGIVENRPDLCGADFCIPAVVSDIRLGAAQIVTTPGESFPESLRGRAEETVDFGGEWGPWTFPAMPGIAASMAGEYKLHFGLAHFEMGYLVPEADYHPEAHPDYYEETFCVHHQAETLVRDHLVELLATPFPDRD